MRTHALAALAVLAACGGAAAPARVAAPSASVASPPPSAPPPPSAVSAAMPATHLPSCSRATPSRCEQPAPSFAADVKPVLERRCFSCHSGDGEAAESHDFSRTETLVAQRADVADEVSSCSMPPQGKPQLSEREASTLLHWIACGSPRP